MRSGLLFILFFACFFCRSQQEIRLINDSCFKNAGSGELFFTKQNRACGSADAKVVLVNSQQEKDNYYSKHRGRENFCSNIAGHIDFSTHSILFVNEDLSGDQEFFTDFYDQNSTLVIQITITVPRSANYSLQVVRKYFVIDKKYLKNPPVALVCYKKAE